MNDFSLRVIFLWKYQKDVTLWTVILGVLLIKKKKKKKKKKLKQVNWKWDIQLAFYHFI